VLFDLILKNSFIFFKKYFILLYLVFFGRVYSNTSVLQAFTIIDQDRDGFISDKDLKDMWASLGE
jgi:Ca2+-binding EF-hand superfamily protein